MLSSRPISDTQLSEKNAKNPKTTWCERMWDSCGREGEEEVKDKRRPTLFQGKEVKPLDTHWIFICIRY